MLDLYADLKNKVGHRFECLPHSTNVVRNLFYCTCCDVLQASTVDMCLKSDGKFSATTHLVC